MRIRTLLVVVSFLSAVGIQAAWPPAIPNPIQLSLRENGGVSRSGEVVRSGVPLPRSLNLTTTAPLAIVDSQGQAVPADFQILARWNAGLTTTTAPIQWLLVTFPASVIANSTSQYRLVTDGSVNNPPPARPLSLTQSGNQIVVDTGAAIFKLGASNTALFDEVLLENGTPIITGSLMTARVNAFNETHPTLRNVVIEHVGPLSVVVRVYGAYDMPATGGGALGSFRRYLFTAGSPTAIIRQAVNFEGDICNSQGAIQCNGAPNAVRVEYIQDKLALGLTPPYNLTAIGGFASSATTATLAAGDSADLRQRLRSNRTSPLLYQIDVNGTQRSSGTKADGGMLEVSTGAGAVAIALNHMHRYEPEALRVLADGSVAINLADDFAWIGARQGLFSQFAVGVFASAAGRATLDQNVWAPLNSPLHAWPQPELFAASDAVDEFPVGGLTSTLAAYDIYVPAALNRTQTLIDQLGLAGLMTFGVFPRNYGNSTLADEVDCAGASDPTPTESWDDTYWCATWTDYHNASANAVYWMMRSGDTHWMDEITNPAAQRMLHTQIMQCSPTDNYFYCGQAPAGYGGYREDFNSSHAYFDNLMLYYWLTGDATVVETLLRGASSMRDYYCSSRPAAACGPNDLPTDQFANLNGRVAMQWHSVFRFVGLASNDPSYLDDYASGLGREYTELWAQLTSNNTTYGFLTDGTLITTPGTYDSDQLWMSAMYDINLLYRLQRDTGNASLRSNPPLLPQAIRTAWARAIVQFAPRVAMGDGTVSGNWPNQLTFSFSGNRIGGTLGTVGWPNAGSDPLLYDTTKAPLSGQIIRSADETGDAALRQMGVSLTNFTLTSMQNEVLPLSKPLAEYLERLHPAVARINASTSYSVGDVNGDGSITVADVFYLVNFLFTSGPAPVGSGDVNGDGNVTVADVFYLVNYIFSGGPAPK